MERSPPSPLPEKKNGEVTTFLKLISTFIIFDPKNLFHLDVVKSKRLPQDIEEKECKLQSRTQGREQEYLSPEHIPF